MQYLIRTIEHKGETFTDVITVRDNERYQVVEAESKAQAEKLAKDNLSKGTKIAPGSKIVKHNRFTEEELIAMFGKDYRKDSE